MVSVGSPFVFGLAIELITLIIDFYYFITFCYITINLHLMNKVKIIYMA